ncbi:hypothetical protein ASG17_07600 [Brevundimonas sp. Leaf363]|uniref:hypothetical protein n=1 Tax=Brevundimonas sp. Leaf363 TaxID=1736353 RepID=UPI0006F251D1|nr:hypothetical protein [Brevundimonas sp. Leaf363]KQS55906.1 hypothetical protein ASG17_07600 [Brevundimonas sp. Leaf363]
MPSFDYSRALATANRLITRYGQQGKLSVPADATGPSYDPDESDPDEHDAVFAVLEYDQKDIDGTRVLRTDKKILLAVGTLPLKPATDHHLLDAAGQAYSVMDVQPLSPAGIDLFYWVQGRA